MTGPRHLSWENFQATVFIHGQQRVHRVNDSPLIEVFGDGVANRVGVWLEAEAGTLIPSELAKLAFIKVRVVTHRGRPVLEVGTDTASIRRQFYHFAVAVTERVIVEKRSALEAVTLELRCFTDLLEETSLLGIERQLGLLGELLFLERLIAKRDVSALDAWLGPMGEPHDFRLHVSEFEVKTTISPRRIHTIHGAEQLVASKGCSLYIVSVLLGPPGASDGFSLAGKVAQLSDRLSSPSTRLAQFEAALVACGLGTAGREHYTRRFVMRRPTAIVPVDATFPAITRPTIQSVLGSLSTRIESVQYDVNVEGLEHEDGTTQFEQALAD